jgi:hypothetical protein
MEDRMLNAAVTNWKTTVVGIAAGLAIFAAQAYQPNMTWKQWGIALASGLGPALLGILSADGVVSTKP